MKKTRRNNPTFWTTTGANLIPLVGVLFFHWDFFGLAVLYWFEAGIIGLLSTVEILRKKGKALDAFLSCFMLWGVWLPCMLYPAVRFLAPRESQTLSGFLAYLPKWFLQDGYWVSLLGITVSQIFAYLRMLQNPWPTLEKVSMKIPLPSPAKPKPADYSPIQDWRQTVNPAKPPEPEYETRTFDLRLPSISDNLQQEMGMRVIFMAIAFGLGTLLAKPFNSPKMAYAVFVLFKIGYELARGVGKGTGRQWTAFKGPIKDP